ncbi:hypothetical protein K9U39_01800 [Rhodoblastus acidophilus]|uniref:Globin-sensor domain-containing protein n=1 Tax=Candidatus Rhodoblastus alkanivorans TaxID=2954117 RepID=A0ABS9Z5C3_9HYPH|nr:protoglobin domain-containing protein [Candidatus Rhodoblastus alkanivorans]MCI4680361.1 hypothetical protein [Candidatus Rhodoblastus alkanivorans]MCI4682382.1 hypothetical protein [Candidatus Rhodoblastus alkanivorans]MDI4639685.1 hypothetical protein [Rhodoblastus acidophilus]
MNDLKRHMDLLARDRSVEERLLTFWPVVEPRLPTIVAQLQKFTRNMAAGNGDGQCDFERLKRVQSRHFARLLSWRIDDDYVDGVLAMHFGFQKAALDTPAITAVYNELARALTTYLVETYRWTPGTLASIQKAVTAALFFDLSMLLSLCPAERSIASAPRAIL